MVLKACLLNSLPVIAVAFGVAMTAFADVTYDDSLAWKFEGTVVRTALATSSIASSSAIDTRGIQSGSDSLGVLRTSRSGIVLNFR